MRERKWRSVIGSVNRAQKGEMEKMEIFDSISEQDKTVFMTAIMSRREKGRERGERIKLKEHRDKIGVFMTAIMSRRERGEGGGLK